MLRILLTTLLLSLCSANLAAAELQPFHASYTADWSQLPFTGKAERSLKNNGNGTWRLSFEASMIVAGLKETSTLRLAGEQIQPLKYRYQRTGLGKAKKTSQDFNWQTYLITGVEKKQPFEMPLLAGVLDKSSYQLALQLDVAAGQQAMSYSVVDGDELDTYDFRVLGEEIITTSVGKLRTIKVERVRDPSQSRRKTTLWFAADWNFLLVQLNQVEKDGKDYTIKLEQGSVNGKPITAMPE